MRYPRTAEDIGPDWLSDALSPRYPGALVAAVEVLERNEVTNAHARLRVRYLEAGGAPEVMFCKLPPVDARRDAIIASGMGVREAHFYGGMAATLPLRTPAAHVAAQDADSGLFALLLEDLVTSGCKVSDGTWGVPPDAAARLLTDLAALHVRFTDPSRRAAEAGWVPAGRSRTSYNVPMLRFGLEHHRDRLSPEFIEIAEVYVADPDRFHPLWHQGPLTVIHGDPHIGNVFMDAGRAGLLDWGIINIGAAMRDVSYLLTMALSVEDRRAHERDLLAHYLDVSRLPLTPDEAWLAHRLHAAYTVPASCQVVTFPVDATPARQVFAAAFLARSEAAVADLESRAALRDVGGF